MTVNAEAAGTILARVRLNVMSSRAGVVFSIAALFMTGLTAATLFLTLYAEKEAAWPPAEVWTGFIAGLE